MSTVSTEKKDSAKSKKSHETQEMAASTEDIAQRIKSIMGAAGGEVEVEVDSAEIANKAVDKVLSKEYLEKFASMVDKEQAGMVTEDISSEVQRAIVSQMDEIISQLDA